MARLDRALENGLLSHKRMEKLFPEGASIDTNNLKHFRVSFNRIEEGEVYDTHEVIITIKSDEELSFLINGRAVIAAMRSLEGENVLKVIDDPPVFNEDKTQLDIRFLVINNIERR